MDKRKGPEEEEEEEGVVLFVTNVDHHDALSQPPTVVGWAERRRRCLHAHTGGLMSGWVG